MLIMMTISVWLLLTLPAEAPGGQQRVWLATNSVLLVILALLGAHAVRVRSVVDGGTQTVTGHLNSDLGADVRGVL